MTHSHVATLAGWILTADGPLRRDHVRKPERRSDHYLERYDATTLFYDCVYLDDTGTYLITAPRFLNLWRPFREGLRLNGVAIRGVQRRTWLRCEQVWFRAPKGSLTLTIAGETREIVPRAALAAAFAGLNSLVAVNKNNDLKWIAAWARYYARAHGAEGVVIFDNGSTTYRPEDIADALSQVEGLKEVAVLTAPFPYGPTDSSRKLEVSPRFFQTSMLNIARRDALSRARAVLSVDIDEIARADSGVRVFDLAVRNPVGMVTIHGSWVYPAPQSEGPQDHGAHVFRQVPDRKCNRKWCATPQGMMSRFGWAVHQIGGVLQNLFTNQSQVSLLHCRGTSTGWKGKRFDLPEKMIEDPDLAAFMARNFPRPT